MGKKKKQGITIIKERCKINRPCPSESRRWLIGPKSFSWKSSWDGIFITYSSHYNLPANHISGSGMATKSEESQKSL